ncbi:allergen Tha p 1 [Anabrus simplex]|uniref:allergen Tha p 1 n=1 Tax=Anabrus simplex TaxID=316456 RepID=UPI0035A3299C
MKVFLLSFVLAVAVSGLVGAQNAEFGTQDPNNVKNILRDRRLVQRQIHCVLDKGPCDKLGNSLKSIIKEVLFNNCSKCSPRQATNAKIIVEHIQKNFPSDYNAIVAHYKQ